MKHPSILKPIELTNALLKRPFSGSHAEDNKHILENAVDWAMEAGKIQLHMFRNSHLQMETKSNIHDMVTEVDKECERLIIENIKDEYPQHGILSEECGETGQNESDWKWVIDPLDGTNNYSQGLPIFAVSIGVQYKGETQVGVVYVPYLDELYCAVKGQGATWNGRDIHVSRKKVLDECVVATGFPYDKATHPANNLDNVCKLLPHLRGLRRMGSAAYDLCCVACGILDGYWELDLKPWDVCAGQLIVEEAGGIVTPFRDDRHISIVAANKYISEQLLEAVTPHE